ncbi:MAG: hypothetical protein AB7N76_30630 [Planctomycetota bacterium]
MRHATATLFVLLVLGSIVLADDPPPSKQPGPQPQPGKSGADSPAPYTEADLRQLYKQGLVLTYLRTATRGGKPAKALVFQEVLETGEKGYLLSTLTFGPDGVAQEREPKREPVPYRVFPEQFTSAKRRLEGKLRLGERTLDTIHYSYQVQAGGVLSWRNVWYSKQYPGLLLKTMVQPTGDLGKKNWDSLELAYLPRELGGPAAFAFERGRLPWEREALMAAWPKGAVARYSVSVKEGDKARELELELTMLHRTPNYFVLGQRISEGGKVVSAAAVPQLWRNFLHEVRGAGVEELSVGSAETIAAAGRSFTCKPYRLKQGEVEATWFLAEDVPGLTVRYETKGPKGGVVRVLTAWSAPKAD